MSELTQADLVRIAHQYYPMGFPPEEDNYNEPLLAFQRTPEHQRWRAAWEKFMQWERWDAFLEELETAFPGHDVWEVTQPWMSACGRCCVYLREPLPDGGRVVTRVAGAVSLLAPLYLVYVTKETLRPGQTLPRQPPDYAPTGEVKPYAEKLARHIEQTFGYRPFPMDLADVPLTDLRIGHLNQEVDRPTLLNALLGENLGNLP